MPRLTKKLLDSATCPEGKIQIRVYDTIIQGFGATIGKTGRKSFFVEFIPPGGGARRRMVVGHYGKLTVEEARNAAKDELAKLRKGVDPLEEKHHERKAGTFTEWKDTYLEIGQGSGRWEARTLREVKRHLERASQAFGRKCLGAVTARDVEIVRNRLHEENGLTVANNFLKVVKAALQEAWKRDLIPSNEAAKVSRISGEVPRTRTLSDDELKKLMEAIEKHPRHTFRVALFWLVMTGARRSEVLRATWSDLRLDPPDKAEWTIPRAKNNRPSVRPLPLELVEEIKRLPRDSTLVVGHWDYRWFDQVFRDFRRKAGLPDDLHLHDIRRTVGLAAARAAGLQVAQRLLGHASIATTSAVYAPLTSDDLRGPQAEVVGKVLAFRRKASGEEETPK